MTVWLWIGFTLFILGLLLVDLLLLHRTPREHRAGEALAWTGAFVMLALLFCVVVYYMYEQNWLGVSASGLTGRQAAMQFLTGYMLEESLSVDNVFVIALIFAYFKVPGIHQHRVLFWGILGALVMRGVMILSGAALIHSFEWIIYVFGGILILTAVKLLFAKEDSYHPERNLLVRVVRRVYPISSDFDGQNFFTRINGRRAATPMLLVLLAIESADAMFAVDSIPAIFAITRDPFIVFTSNMFAILGLRSLYFALAAIMNKMRYLKTALVIVLAFVGVKMLLSHNVNISTPVSLAVVAGILGVGVLASVIVAKQERNQNPDRKIGAD